MPNTDISLLSWIIYTSCTIELNMPILHLQPIFCSNHWKTLQNWGLKFVMFVEETLLYSVQSFWLRVNSFPQHALGALQPLLFQSVLRNAVDWDRSFSVELLIVDSIYIWTWWRHAGSGTCKERSFHDELKFRIIIIQTTCSMTCGHSQVTAG